MSNSAASYVAQTGSILSVCSSTRAKDHHDPQVHDSRNATPYLGGTQHTHEKLSKATHGCAAGATMTITRLLNPDNDNPHSARPKKRLSCFSQTKVFASQESTRASCVHGGAGMSNSVVRDMTEAAETNATAMTKDARVQPKLTHYCKS